jgi:hypothetical protein
MATVKNFYRDQELKNVWAMPNEKFAALFPGERGMRCDSFSKWAGYPLAGFGGPLPVQRKITYKSFPSRHECNSKCLNGRHDGACECSCQGVNHGLGALLKLAN